MNDSAESGGDSGKGLRLRILATTDLHLHLLPYDYYTDRPQPAKGLAQAASLVRALRAEMPDGACLLFDNGDALSGSLLSDLLSARFQLITRPRGTPDPVHPMIAAMNALGYDAGPLGNHEFDHGLPFLRAALNDAAFPVVSANLLDAGGERLVAPWTILDQHLPGCDGMQHRVRVGILGLGPRGPPPGPRRALAAPWPPATSSMPPGRRSPACARPGPISWWRSATPASARNAMCL